MPYANYTNEEVAARGEAIYAEQLRGQVEADNKGKFLVLDIETGDYEIDADDAQASLRMLSKRPEAVLYGLRIGHRAAYRMGWRFRYTEDRKAREAYAEALMKELDAIANSIEISGEIDSAEELRQIREERAGRI